jgi:hypothetical protein
VQVFVNANYPNRIELDLGSLTGPFVAGDVPFDPRQSLEVYIAGVPVAILAFGFDVPNNRYLMFTQNLIDTTAITQVIYHMPATVFTAGGTTVPGFALVAGVSTVIDPVTPSVGLAVPASLIVNQQVMFTWTAVGAAQIEITTTSGYNSGLISATASAGVVFASGFTSSGSFTATIAALDGNGNPVLVNGTALTTTIPLNISS